MKESEVRKISFIGGGIIAEVFIRRLIDSGFVFQNNIMVSDLTPERLEFFKETFNVQVTNDNGEAAVFGDFVFLAVPPAQVKIVLSENCKDLRKDQILISLAAAVPIWLIEGALYKKIAVIRVIPNTPSQVGKGVNPYCFGTYLLEQQIQDAKKLLEIFGDAMEFDESQMNLATAISAVGPTYWLPAIQSLIDFSIKHGMSKETAFEIVCSTLTGTAELVKITMKNPDDLKLQIGTRTMNEEGLKSLFSEAVESAFNKILLSEKKLSQ